MVVTGLNSSSQMYMMRNSALVGPCGVSIKGAKSTLSWRMNWLRSVIRSRSRSEGPTRTPSPANEYRGLRTQLSRSSGQRSNWSRKQVFGTDGWSRNGSENLLIRKYQLG